MGLESQLAALRCPAVVQDRARNFPVPTGFVRKRAKDWAEKRLQRRARTLIHRDNARAFVGEAWPAVEESVFAVVCGDFVFGDIVPAVIERHGPPAHLWLTTLSLSLDNIEMLREALRSCPVSLAISSFFERMSPEIYAGLEKLREVDGFRLCTGRLHTKLMLWDFAEPVVIEGSANLRSNNSLEQLALHQSAPLFFFHRDWLTRLWALAEGGGDYARI